MHPPSETLARFVEGVLSEDERAVVTAELARCAECRAVVGALARRAIEDSPIPRTFTPEVPDDALAPLTAGATIAGRYRVRRPLGEGGMGVVYDVEHTLLARRFALKMLHPVLAARRDAVRRFLGEARALAHLGHRGIVEVLDTGNDDAGSPFLVMPLLEGETLEALLEREGALSIERTLQIAEEIAVALAFAHGRGVVHRDVKPANVFVLEAPHDGANVKLLDFGIAKLLDPDVTRTGSGVMLGTPRYMAPEQWSRPREVDARVDVFAWGVTVHRMLTGELPYAWAELAVQGATITRPDVRRKRPETPIALTSLLERCLALDPSARPHDAAEIARALEALRAARVSTRPRAPEAERCAPTRPDARDAMSVAPEHATIAWQQSAVLVSAPHGTIHAHDLGALGTPEPVEALAWLRGQQILSAEQGPEGLHRFVEGGDAALAYESMDPSVRRAIHALAASLRGRGLALDAGSARWVEVAHHLECAGHSLEASDAYARAALGPRAIALAGDDDTTLALSAPSDTPRQDVPFALAARWAEQAIALAQREDARRADQDALTLVVVEGLEARGELAIVIERLEALLPRLGGGLAARASVILGTALQRSGEGVRALEMLARAAELARVAGPSARATLALALGRHAVGLAFAGKIDEARDRLAEAEPIVLVETTELRADLAGWKAQIAGVAGDLGERRDAYWAAVELFRTVGNARFAAFSLLNLGDTYARLGAYEDAERALTRAHAECTELGATVMTGYAALNLAQTLAHLDRGPQAIEWLERARVVVEQTHEPRLQRYLTLYAAQLALTASTRAHIDAESAIAALDRLVPSEGLGELDASFVVQAQTALARAELMRRRGSEGEHAAVLARARERAERARAVFDDAGGLEEGEAELHLVLADVYEAGGEAGAAREVLREGARRVRQAARRIAGALLRDHYLEDVIAHRTLLARAP